MDTNMTAASHLQVFTNVSTVLTIFVIEILLFHLVLVAWLKLSRRAWKIVDYIWLGFATLGIFGAAGQARQLVANNMTSTLSQQTQASYMLLFSLVGQYSNEGAVCRTFVRGQYSPPPAEFERTQKDYDSVCQWFRDIQRKLPTASDKFDEGLPYLDPRSLTPEPSVPERELNDILLSFHKLLDIYNGDAQGYADVIGATKRLWMEDFLIISSPLLVSFALALRITKVTGEIRLG
jgi:hypothetical protein